MTPTPPKQPPPTLLLATRNRGKLVELTALMAAQPWAAAAGLAVAGAADRTDLPDPEETGTTFAENAALKALAYAEAAGTWCLADDSGLEVDALDGRPGVLSARYAADDAARMARLLAELDAGGARTPAERAARFRCAMALASPDGRVVAETSGTLEGYIADSPAGLFGFGYDPLLMVPELGRRLAETEPAIKNAMSHRGRALAAMLPHLRVALGHAE